jgi:ABC-type proline/glycine betaine transport system permease subunit
MKFISVCKKRDNFIVTKKGEKQVGVIYMICGFALFAIVLFPLGLGWQVKNLILWDMPLTYVPSLSHTTNQYVGFHSVLERFFGVNAETIGNPFVIWGDDGVHSFWEYNMGLGALKTGLFGEDDFFALGGSSEIEEVVISAVGKFVCAFLYVFAWGLVILSVISIFMFFKKKCCGMSKISVRMLAIIFVTFLGNYVVFCFGYPFTCTMNFRYIVPCLLLPIVSLSACSGEASVGKGSALGQLYVKGVSVCTKGFCIFGALSYVLLALMPY